MKPRLFVFLCSFLLLFAACRHEVIVWPEEVIPIGDTTENVLRGFYLLNEGNMGSNKASLDFYDFRSATYTRNLYADRNPSVPKELGDVGNDLVIYGNRLYAVINCSNKIEVMTADSAHRIGQIDIPNCRYLCFDGKYGYCTSYAGPVVIGKEHAQIGYVARFDTATLHIDRTCLVGYQPDGISVLDGKLYVANSGGYMSPDYETTLSVISLETFTEEKRIEVAPNLQYVVADRFGQLWVTSRGDNNMLPASVYCLQNQQLSTVHYQLPIGAICLCGDSLYIIGKAFNMTTLEEETTYATINTQTGELETRCFITDGTEKQIKQPYGIAVNPVTRDIYVTDAKTYVDPGMLHCYSPDGILRWSVRTGDIPAHFAFYYAK